MFFPNSKYGKTHKVIFSSPAETAVLQQSLLQYCRVKPSKFKASVERWLVLT